MVNEKAKTAQKNSFQNIKAVFSVACEESGKWKTITNYYGYFNENFNRFLQVSDSNRSVRVTL